ncbi:MAG: hypothetical protein IJS06_06620 [Prevotella sp.]|nr:hypothetical protein [Prevotella sp.]
MKKINIILALLLTLSPITEANAQRKTTKKTTTKTAVKTAAKTQRAYSSETTKQPSDVNVKMFESMVPSTAKLMFIDSVVVDKKDFLNSLPLNKESGKLTYFNSFFNANKEVNTTVYINEFKNRSYYAEGDSTQSSIYTIDKLGNKWSIPVKISEITTDYQNPDYPFLCSDGVTLFFGAKGPKSMGGYDIFMTRYNGDDGTWYEPENYGLPYNSTANDYLLAIDDYDQLGWLVTDRRQEEGKVCIYTFVPTTPRQNFENDDLTKKQLNSFARILKIEDTWQFGNREAALKRVEDLKKRNTQGKKVTNNINFVINDNVTYHSISEFKSSSAREKYKQLVALQDKYNQNIATLQQLRDDYAKNRTKDLAKDILFYEKEVEQQTARIKDLKKIIREQERGL